MLGPGFLELTFDLQPFLFRFRFFLCVMSSAVR